MTVTVVRGDDIDAMARVTTDQLRMEETKKNGRKMTKDRDIVTMIRLSLMPLLYKMV